MSNPFSRILLVAATLVMAGGRVAAAEARADLAEAIVLTPQGGASREDREIARWQERARVPEAKAEVFERLGWAFVAKARRTLDTGYYKLAEQTAAAMDRRFGPSVEARLMRGHVLHNLHRFREAETLARELTTERGSAEDFALLSDALMEQGKLAGAAEALQRMVNLKPGVEAYSRIAHCRWLKGDLAGAIGAMKNAERASSPHDAETGAWTLVRLSAYYLQADDVPRALGTAESALGRLADYPPALLARGRVLVALGRSGEAMRVLQRAAELNPLPEYQWWLAEVLRATGDFAQADEVEARLLARGEVADPHTLALFLATQRRETSAAVALGRAELGSRADVFSHDALAWALAASGDLPEAGREMELALAEGTQDARLFWHAGEIAMGRAEQEAAGRFFARAQPLANTLLPGERARLMRRLAAGTGVARAN